MKNLIIVGLTVSIVLLGCKTKSREESLNISGEFTAIPANGNTISPDVRSRSVNTEIRPMWFHHQWDQIALYLVDWGSDESDFSGHIETHNLLDEYFPFSVRGNLYVDINNLDYWRRFEDTDVNKEGEIDPFSREYPLLSNVRMHSNDIAQSPDGKYTVSLWQDAVGAVSWQVKQGDEDLLQMQEVKLSLVECDGVEFSPVVFDATTSIAGDWPWVTNEPIQPSDKTNNREMIEGYAYLHSLQLWSGGTQADIPDTQSAHCKLELSYTAQDGIENTELVTSDFNVGDWYDITFSYDEENQEAIIEGLTNFREADWTDPVNGGEIDTNPRLPLIQSCVDFMINQYGLNEKQIEELINGDECRRKGDRFP